MRHRLLEFVVCPRCGSDLELEREARETDETERGMLACVRGHRYPIVDGVPRLLPDSTVISDDAQSIQSSFTQEWQHFDYERDRTWGQTADRRRNDFLRHVDLTADELAGRIVLDAGCGVGVLSAAISGFGCEVIAVDLGHQVVDAYNYFTKGGRSEQTYFLQADLMVPPFRGGSFDVVFCAGVLHHTPNTKNTFDLLVPAVAPGGRMFVWLYHHVAGVTYELKSRLRPVLADLPARVRHAIVLAALPQALVRQRMRIASGRQNPTTRLNAHEKLITMLDSFTCRYRWEHTQEEVAGWFDELGFVDIKTTEVGPDGFGVVATRGQHATVTRERPHVLTEA